MKELTPLLDVGSIHLLCRIISSSSWWGWRCN